MIKENMPASGFNEEDIELKLWEYIDGLLEPADRSAIEKLIADNAEWKSKYQELLGVHEAIQFTELEQPSMRFTKNVMEEIAKYKIAPAAKEYINNKVVWGIAAFFITAIVGFLIYGLSAINWNEGSSDNPIGIDLTKIDYSQMLNNTYLNYFMMVNVVLALALLDRYLANKKKKYMEKV